MSTIRRRHARSKLVASASALSLLSGLFVACDGGDDDDDDGGSGGTTSSGARGGTSAVGGTSGSSGKGAGGSTGGTAGASSVGGSSGKGTVGGAAGLVGAAGDASDAGEGGGGSDEPSGVEITASKATGNAPLTVDFSTEFADDIGSHVWVVNDISGAKARNTFSEDPQISTGEECSYTFTRPGNFRVQLFTFFDDGTVVDRFVDIRVTGLHLALTAVLGLEEVDRQKIAFTDDGGFVAVLYRGPANPAALARYDAAGEQSWTALGDGDGVATSLGLMDVAALGEQTGVLYRRVDDRLVGILDADGELDGTPLVVPGADVICGFGDELTVVGSVPEEPIEGAEGEGEVFVMRLDASLDVTWVRLVAAVPNDLGCVVDGAGNVAIHSDGAGVFIVTPEGDVATTGCDDRCSAVAALEEGFLLNDDSRVLRVSPDGDEEELGEPAQENLMIKGELEDGTLLFGGNGHLVLVDGETVADRKSFGGETDVRIRGDRIQMMSSNSSDTGFGSDVLAVLTTFDTSDETLPGAMAATDAASGPAPFSFELEVKAETPASTRNAPVSYGVQIVLEEDDDIGTNGQPKSFGAGESAMTTLTTPGFLLVNTWTTERDGYERASSLVAYSVPKPKPPGCSCDTNDEGVHICTGATDATSSVCDGCPDTEFVSTFRPKEFCSVETVRWCCKALSGATYTYTYIYEDCTECTQSGMKAACDDIDGTFVNGPCTL